MWNHCHLLSDWGPERDRSRQQWIPFPRCLPPAPSSRCLCPPMGLHSVWVIVSCLDAFECNANFSLCFLLRDLLARDTERNGMAWNAGCRGGCRVHGRNWHRIRRTSGERVDNAFAGERNRTPKTAKRPDIRSTVRETVQGEGSGTTMDSPYRHCGIISCQ